jgi:hemolysin III
MTSITVQKFKDEEFINVITHAPGILIGFIFSAFLLAKYPDVSASHIIGYSIYGLSFIIIYAASTIYHNAKCSDKKQFLKKVDHACIYIFMAGCYTPFVLINMNEGPKYWFLGLVWLIAIIGVIYKFFSKYKSSAFSLTLYFSFSYMCFLAKAELLDNIPQTSFDFLVYGGIFYTIGAIFYSMRKLPYHHGIWHILVLCGSGSHFYAIYSTY